MKMMIINFCGLKYYDTSTRKKNKKLPSCFNTEINHHKFDTEKEHWIGYGTDQKGDEFCEFLNDEFLSNTQLFNLKILIIAKKY